MDVKVCRKNGGQWLSKAHLCNFKKMKNPKYSSIEWQLHGDRLKTDREHVVAKGTVSEIKKDNILNKYVEMKKRELPISLKIKPGTIVKWEFEVTESELRNTMKLGNSLYSRRKLYEIAEEITGEKILTKGDRFGNRKVVKRAVGMKLELDALQGTEPDLPLLIEGNKGYYVIAPIIKND